MLGMKGKKCERRNGDGEEEARRWHSAYTFYSAFGKLNLFGDGFDAMTMEVYL